LPPERRRDLLADHIGMLASGVMGLPAAQTSTRCGILQLGMDSLMSVSLQRSLAASLGITLPAAVIYESPTIRRLTDALCERMGYATAAKSRRKVHPALGHGQAACRARQVAQAATRDMGSGDVTDHTNDSNSCRPTRLRSLEWQAGFRCQFSDTFWDNLCRGEESVTTLSEEALTAAGVSRDAADPAYVRRAALIDGIHEFDAEYFGMTPYTARMMDPQQRLFLQTAWHAFEDSGYDPATYDGAIGVFGSSTASGYLLHNLMSHRDQNALVGEGITVEMFNLVLLNDKDYPATRVSHQFNLRGPSISVQTACSSSLVAVHLACQSLLSGESDMVLAGAARSGCRITSATDTSRGDGVASGTAGRSTFGPTARSSAVESRRWCSSRCRQRSTTVTASTPSSAARRSTTTAR
jgi:hypothetical protein